LLSTGNTTWNPTITSSIFSSFFFDTKDGVASFAIDCKISQKFFSKFCEEEFVNLLMRQAEAKLKVSVKFSTY
jgi:hypothetical protein